MTPCRRILVVGPPASGKRWLAGRIHALTGLEIVPLAAADTTGPRELTRRREWIALTSEVEATATALPAADLVVLLGTPRLLRDARLVLRRIRALLRRRPHPPLRSLMVRSHRWSEEILPRHEALLEPHGPLVASCASTDEVRRVLERVLGMPPDAGP